MSEHLAPEEKAEWREDARERAAEVLVAHRYYDTGEYDCCACGLNFYYDQFQARDRHIIAALAEAGLLAHEDDFSQFAGGAIRRAEKAERERDVAREALARVREVHERYFDTDRMPGSWDDHLGTPDPEPEDVWRFDRDFRAALAGTDPTDTEGDDRD